MAAQHMARRLFFPALLIASAAAPAAANDEDAAEPAAEAPEQAPTTFGIRFQVAEVEGEPVVDTAWLDEHVRWANRLFAPAEVAFERRRVEPLEAEHADLVTRTDRHELGPKIEGHLIHVFVVRSLADVDIEGRFISGVHWRSWRGGEGPGGNRRHYVILSSIAAPAVLAHELGHFFGNPHSDTPGNIMSYEDAPGPPFFDERQLRRIRRHREQFLRDEELVPVGG